MTTLKQTIIGILLSGWEFEEGSLAPEDMDHIIKIHNANNESAWQEVKIIYVPKPSPRWFFKL